jgi:hypothetical protein
MIPAKSKNLNIDWSVRIGHTISLKIFSAPPLKIIFIVELACLEQELLQTNPKQMRRQHTT